MATKRPLSSIIFGVFHLIFGAMGFLTTLLALVVTSGGMPEGAFDLQALLEEGISWYGTYSKTAMVIGLFVSLLLIVAGIGLFQLREWARKASIVYGIYGLVSGLLGLCVNLFYVTPLLEQLLKETTNEIERAGIIGGMAGGIIGVGIALIYPILVLIFMNRRVLKEAIDDVEYGEEEESE